MKRAIAVLTTGRQDWGILRDICLRLNTDSEFELRLLIGGMHLSRRFGMTCESIRADGFASVEELDWVNGSESDPCEQASKALVMIGGFLQRSQPESLLLVGDRFETAAAALAATLQRIPVVHLHGGEETEGAIDNVLRHAISKLSHLHFTSHGDHSKRLIAMGEDATTIFDVGAPALDNLHRQDLPSREQLELWLGLPLRQPVVLVTMHPATLSNDPVHEAQEVAAAMDLVNATYIVTLPNVDRESERVRSVMVQAGVGNSRRSVEALGERNYWGMMLIADAMLGNSSSALIEAPSVHLPAVNVGERQTGRLRGPNVIDATPDRDAIALSLRKALSAEFRTQLRAMPSRFGQPGASSRILALLRKWKPPVPPRKRFRIDPLVERCSPSAPDK